MENQGGDGEIPPIGFGEGMAEGERLFPWLGFKEGEKRGFPGIPLGHRLAEEKVGKKPFSLGVLLAGIL